MSFWRGKTNLLLKKRPLRAGTQVKRTLLPLPLQAVMTVEAALVLPLFLFFMSNVLFIFDMIRLQSGMTAALHEAGKQMAEYSYFYRYALSDLMNIQAGEADYEGETGADLGTVGNAALSFVLSQTYVRSQVNSMLGTGYLDHTCLEGGSGGISYLRSSILLGEPGSGSDIVDLVADYRVRPLFRMFGLKDFSMQSRFYAHAWVGYGVGEITDEEEKEKEETVYITETGTVYHKDRGCTYLNPSVRSVNVSELAGMRNKGGGRYYPCEICDPQSAGTVVITSDGNRYHSSAACPGLKRTIYAVPLSSVEGEMPACSKCGGG
jgi:hypothetical protein